MRVFNSADILIPRVDDMTAWSVVACDQYTSEPQYWEKAEETVGNKPSTLRIIYPEVYLSENNGEKRIKKINETMVSYIEEGIFKKYENSVVLSERRQRDGRVRYGVIGTVDLEQYDFSKGSSSLIRATEGTVLDRIPPRVKMRKNACLEVPHIIMLIDDREKMVIEPLVKKKQSFKMLYDFDLQMNSGHITGYLPDVGSVEDMLSAAESLSEKETFLKKYNIDAPVLQYAVGDGNHSLATAKTCWEDLKNTLTAEERETHPARFALVELMNIHDSALEFEPIHRVVFGIDAQQVMNAFAKFYPQLSREDNGGQQILCCYGGREETVYIKGASSNLPVGTLTTFLDDYVSNYGGSVDYIHGSEVVKSLSERQDSIGFILPSMKKNQLFETVLRDGALPRKTFSMGEAEDKRFYLECKIIRF